MVRFLHCLKTLPVRAVALVLLWAALWTPALAAETAWNDYGQGRVRLVSATENASGELVLGLQYQIAPGWEIYWRSPGEAGFPTTIVWDGSDNIVEPRIDWPLPHRFEIFDLETYGYTGEVVLPIVARASRAGDAVAIRAEVNFLTCEEVCIPHTLPVSLDLPAAGGSGPRLSQHAALINKYRALVPPRDDRRGLHVERVDVLPGREGQRLQVVARSDRPFVAPDVFVEGPPSFVFTKPAARLSDGGMRAVLSVPVATTALAGMEPPQLLGTELTLTLLDGERAVEQTLTASLGAADEAAFLPFFAILALALLGGLILNVMPCVLPVLSIKLLHVVAHGGGAQAAVRQSFVATAAGILAAFVALAAILVGLQAGGAAVGWGVQFQQPLFIVAMTLVVTLFAANLWGFFELRLPTWLAGAGSAVDEDRHSLGGAFAGGVFATVLATPCSAPFLGTAVGFALARGPVEIFAIFIALGLGMATPFLLVAAVPRLATMLPKPGRWMIAVRRVLGLALAGTAVWLVSILGFQVSAGAAYGLAALMVAILGLLATRSRWPAALRPVAHAAVVVVAILSLATPQLASTVAPAEQVDDSYWQPFDAEAIPQLVAAGKVVFVDVTAEWCLTCKVNKELVLNRGAVAALLRSPDVVAMRADWTNPDEGIARYLASFNRYGIPFNAVYGSLAPNGLALPELLKESVVLDSMTRAAGRNLVASGS